MCISIRKLSLNDVTVLQKLFLNEKNLKDTGVNVLHDEITIDFMNDWLNERIYQYSLEKPDFLIYAILNNKENVIGTIGIGDIDHKNKVAEIGYWVSNGNTGKGYCTSAVREFIIEIRKIIILSKIIAVISLENIASYKILKNNNFEIIEKLKNKMILEIKIAI